MKKSVTRLYKTFQPEHYGLTIELDEAAMRFSGHVIITGKKAGRPSQRLTFHANGLKVTAGKITVRDKKGEREVPITRINQQKTLHEVRLHTDTLLYPGEYTVEMTFEAPITAGMTGIYPCNFTDGKTEKKLFATQFESHHAREAFPCIDEPEAKATFDLTLITKDNVEVLSNTPITEQHRVKSQEIRDKMAATPVRSAGASEQRVGEERADSEQRDTGTRGRGETPPKKMVKWLETRFQTTPRMSTYLLAFVTGEMHKKSSKTKSGVDVSVWATVAQPASSLDFALDVAIKSIEYFEDYFGVPYPLAKADHVALPDFSSGAMENWGLITYRERVLLAYADQTGQSARETIALVIAHETSHQWFGNLVTMRWWNDLWLNESFANMMEYQCVDSFFPDWHVWDSFVAGEGLSAFRRDAIYGVQSVRTDVHHPDEISSLFDPSIVYAKGGRLLYMLKNYVGEKAFRKGLSTYFTAHAYGNTEGDDLWQALSEASGKDIGAFMTPWLTRSGFPVLHVGQSKTKLVLKQEHFLDNPKKADSERIWPLPLFADNTTVPALFTQPETSVEMTGNDIVLFNAGSRGHYLVHYTSETQLESIVAKIRSGKLSEADRLMLLNSASMFSRAGYDSFGKALRLLDAYRGESSEPVWGMIGLILSEARRFVDLDQSLEPALKSMSTAVVKEQLERLGWDEKPDEPAADQKLRGLILGLGLYGEDPILVTEATRRFAAYKDGTDDLPAELRGILMSIPIKNGDAAAFDFLVNAHDNSQNSDLKSDIADALTATRDPKKASFLLARLKDSKLIKPQDADRWLVYLLRNRYTRATAWQWMVDNWSWLEETYKHDKSYDYIPRYAASCVNTPEYQKKFDDLFLEKLSQPLLRRNIELGREEIATRVAWLQRDLKDVQKFFKA